MMPVEGPPWPVMYFGGRADCHRCYRPIVLLPEPGSSGRMPVWQPAGEGFTADREDCQARSGERCTPYPPDQR
jgi:hypothetical protein